MDNIAEDPNEEVSTPTERKKSWSHAISKTKKKEKTRRVSEACITHKPDLPEGVTKSASFDSSLASLAIDDVDTRTHSRVYYLDNCAVVDNKMTLELRNKTTTDNTISTLVNDLQHYLELATKKVNKGRTQRKLSFPMPGRRNNSVGNMSCMLPTPKLEMERVTWTERGNDDGSVDVEIAFDASEPATAHAQIKIYEKAMEKLMAFQTLKDMQFI